MSLIETESLPVDRLVDAFRCRRLPWWREQGLAKERESEAMPMPWPAKPPGWRWSGQGWPRTIVQDADGLWGRCDWMVKGARGHHLVVLGELTPTHRLRLRMLGALWESVHGEKPGLWFQPTGVSVGRWDGVWPITCRARVEPLAVPDLMVAADQVRATLNSPWPPDGTAPSGRCWDCPGFCFCGDRG